MAQTVELGVEGTPARGPGPDPLIGQSLLHYKVVEVIGQGGMSVVYRGHDEHLHRDVAIKVLHPFLAEKAECRARLAREARAVARLEHPHVLKVFDFSGDPDTIDEKPGGNLRVRGFAEGFIIAELVRGPTLKRFVEDHELWKCPEVGAMVVWQIACALEHAHKNGVVHRDIKPENVMVREDGWLKLMDFGIAQIADQKGLTITGTLLGSPAHMAPECIDGHPADERSDLFSLGTVLYWITTGCLPFEALTPHALLKQIVEGKSQPAQQRSPKISDDLARVIAKAMATKPTDRFENAGQFVSALGEVLERAGLPADATRLRVILGNVDEELPRASAEIRAAFLKRAEAHLFEGAPARALACLNRVLAENKDDPEARALIEKAHVPEDTTGDDDKLPAAVEDKTATTVVLEPQAPVIEPRAFGRVLQQAALVVAAVGLIAGAFALAGRFDDKRVDDKKPEPPDAPVVPEPAPPDEIELGKPAENAAAVVVKKVRDPRAVGKLVAVEPPKVDPPKMLPAVVTKRVVKLRAKPWANMFVDGEAVATGLPLKDVELTVGKHVVGFRHPSGKDVDVNVDVGADGAVPDIAVELEPRPAYLVVKCDQPDAFVSVSGKGGKPAKETEAAPLVVALGTKWQSQLDVTVYKKGFTPVYRKIEFQAGQRVPLDIQLVPEAAPPPAP